MLDIPKLNNIREKKYLNLKESFTIYFTFINIQNNLLKKSI